ncbi:hypothetical protein BBJ29_000604 [Phytophthora kernoviae]|uniref:Uncharacterized protein n=1 Tax=Phytophthora kernoviae TaxID=325452 RepID=A0A3R7GBE4_9STRA|nr:hypothetical protein BBJ29_000604 [Phytophthora kernoviae]
MASKRLDAVKLAKSSRWEELRRLVDAEPATAQQVDSYGMLPLHWACTEPQSIGEGVLLALLKAFPQGARAENTAEMLPLQIAIKAQARIEWLQALLASYPDAVLKKAPSGENAVLLARKAGLPNRSVKLLEEMYHHVCAKEGLPDQLAMEEQEVKLLEQAQVQQQQQQEGQLRPSERFQAIAGDLPVPVRVSGVQIGQQRPRRLSNTAQLKMRSFSDNDFYAQQMNITLGTNANPNVNPNVTSAWSPRRATETNVKPQIAAQRMSTNEAQRSPPSMLERHVSAPARAPNSGPYGPAGGAPVNDQVAILQKQVSQLMEEKQQAEMQLRVQAEMLNDPERLTAVSRTSTASGGSAAGNNMPTSRDRQNSLPMQMHTGTNLSAGGNAIPAPNPGISMYRSTGQLLNRTMSAGNFRAREIDIDSPNFGDDQPQAPQEQQKISRSGSTAGNPALQRTTRLQDALNTIAAVESTYDDIEGSESDSDIDGRETDVGDLHDAEADAEIDDVAREYLIDEDEGEDEDDDDDEEAVVEAAKAANATVDDELESEDEVGGDTLPEVDVLVSLGHVMMEKGSVSAAVQAFTRAVEIRPEDPALHALLGRAYYADENLDDAVASIAKSLELEPSATNSTLLGKILFEKGDHENAIAAYQRSLDMQK